MILLHPFQETKLKVRVLADFQMVDSNLNLQFSVFDELEQIQDFYPFEAGTTKLSTTFKSEDLWKTTCFEIFIKSLYSENYHEFNFNSKGDWNIFNFSSYRQRDKNPIRNPSVTMTKVKLKEVNQLSFQIDLKDLEAIKVPSSINLCAVIKSDSTTTYWSQKHNGTKPDFHDSNNFNLVLKRK